MWYSGSEGINHCSGHNINHQHNQLVDKAAGCAVLTTKKQSFGAQFPGHGASAARACNARRGERGALEDSKDICRLSYPKLEATAASLFIGFQSTPRDLRFLFAARQIETGQSTFPPHQRRDTRFANRRVRRCKHTTPWTFGMKRRYRLRL